ncbi:MAG: cupin domain-containing protein [Thermoanaerobaculia bacterium]
MRTKRPEKSLAAVLFDLPEAREFLARYWPDRIVAVHGDLRRFGRLGKVGLFRDIRSLIKTYPGQIFSASSGRVSVEEALSAYDKGVTIQLANIHDHIPEILGWTRRLAREVGVPPVKPFAVCNAFASPRGKAMPLHRDDLEVIVLQLRGSKRWRVAKNDDLPYVPSSPPVRTRIIDMKPGSVCLLPRGTWHSTDKAKDSFSLSFGFGAPSWVDVLLDRIRAALVYDPQWRALAVGAWSGGTREADARAALERLLVGWTDKVGPLDPEEMIRAFQARRAVFVPVGRRIGGRYRLRRAKRSQITVRRKGSVWAAALVDSAGTVLEMEVPADQAPLFRWLSSRKRDFDQTDAFQAAATLSSDQTVAVLQLLAAAGVLEPVSV